MKWASKKRQKSNRIAAVERVKFAGEASSKACWFCGSGRDLCVHEIACGSHRPKAFGNRITWAIACWDCNSRKLTNYALWPLVRQLAIKLRFDPSHFDVVAFNLLRGRAAGAITKAEVLVAYCREYDGGPAP